MSSKKYKLKGGERIYKWKDIFHARSLTPTIAFLIEQIPRCFLIRELSPPFFFSY